MTTGERYCPECGALLHGEWCSQCGRKGIESLWGAMSWVKDVEPAPGTKGYISRERNKAIAERDEARNFIRWLWAACGELRRQRDKARAEVAKWKSETERWYREWFVSRSTQKMACDHPIAARRTGPMGEQWCQWCADVRRAELNGYPDGVADGIGVTMVENCNARNAALEEAAQVCEFHRKRALERANECEQDHELSLHWHAVWIEAELAADAIRALMSSDDEANDE